MNKSTLPATPYKGLIPYAEEDAPFFFGRDPDKEIITANLMARRLTLLYGPSGVGKSSVLRAGVEHHLLEQARQNLDKRGKPEFAVVVFNQWRDNPRVYLELEVLKSVAQACGGQLLDNQQMPDDLVEIFRINAARVGGRLLIILDQFEEYFLYHAQEDGPGTFAADFPRALSDPDLPISFLISIREDALAKLDKFEGRIPHLFDNYLRIEHLDTEAAREAIEKPIARYNQLLETKEQEIEIEPALVDAVLDQVKTGQVVIGEAGRGSVAADETENTEARIETPFLQLVMTRLWQEEIRSGSRKLRLETLNRLGGAKRIVETHLDEAMRELSGEEQRIASLVFQHLVTRSRTKIAYPVLDLAEEYRLAPEQILSVVETLSSGENRILRPVAAPLDQPELLRYEIFHDVLANAILDWRRRYVETRERAETEKKLEIEADERAKAEQRLAREQMLVRRQRWGLVALAAMLLAMLALTWWAFEQRAEAKHAQASEAKQRAEAITQKDNAEKAQADAETARDGIKQALDRETRQREEADKQRIAAVKAQSEANRQRLAAVQAEAEAEKQRDVAETASIAAVKERNRAEEQAKVSQSRELAASAIAESQFNPELGVLLANEALKVKYTPQAQDAFRQAMIVLPARAVLRGHTSIVRSAAFSPDGKLVVTASEDGTARVWDIRTGQSLKELGGPTNFVQSAAFSPDSKLIVTASNDRTARVWDAGTGQNLKELRGHTDALSSAAFSPDGKLIITASVDGTVRVWHAGTGQSLKELSGHTSRVSSASFSPDGKLIVTASHDKTARVWDAVTGQSLMELRGHTNYVRSAAFSPDGKLTVTASGDRTARVWDAVTGLSLRELRGHTGAVSSAAFSPDGKLVVTASTDGTARVWDANTGQSLQELRGHTSLVQSAAFSSDGKLIVTASRDGTARVWDVGTGQSLKELRGHTDAVTSAAFSPDGKLIVTASADGTARVWDAGTGQSLKELRGHIDVVQGAAFSLDGKLIVTASDDRSARVWDAVTGQSLKELRGHTSSVSSAAFSPDGKLIVTASVDGTGRIWDAGTGQSLRELRGHTDGVFDAAFSPGGNLIVTASGDGTARVWDAVTGQSLRDLRGHTGAVLSAAFSPDSKWIVTAGEDQKGIIYPWEAFAPFDDLQRAARIRVVRELTPEERVKYLHESQKK